MSKKLPYWPHEHPLNYFRWFFPFPTIERVLERVKGEVPVIVAFCWNKEFGHEDWNDKLAWGVHDGSELMYTIREDLDACDS